MKDRESGGNLITCRPSTRLRLPPEIAQARCISSTSLLQTLVPRRAKLDVDRSSSYGLCDY